MKYPKPKCVKVINRIIILFLLTPDISVKRVQVVHYSLNFFDWILYQKISLWVIVQTLPVLQICDERGNNWMNKVGNYYNLLLNTISRRCKRWDVLGETKKKKKITIKSNFDKIQTIYRTLPSLSLSNSRL